MKSIKGLERSWVVWRTSSPFDRRSTIGEWIFTILTRSTAVTVLALDAETPEETQAVVARLDSSSLLFWNDEAQTTFNAFARHLDARVDPLRIAGALVDVAGS